MYEPIEIDGRDGEGGGQIVRTSAALAAVTATPLRVIRVRAGRKNPGLQPQHLAAVQAVATLCSAETEGLRLGSERFRLVPGPLRGGSFRFSVTTAGSTGLVMQAILPVLLRAPEPSEVVLEGGTHVRTAPPFDFLEQAFLPALADVGVEVSLRLERPGFYPKGGGRMVLAVEPWRAPRPLSRLEPVDTWTGSARAYVGKLPGHVLERAERTLRARGFEPEPSRADLEPSLGPGFAATLALHGARASEVLTAIGEKGTPVEVIIEKAVEEARAFEAKEVPVGPFLADQLLLYLALGSGGRFRTVDPTLHFETQARIIARFLGERVTWTKTSEDHVLVEVEGAGLVPAAC